MAQEPGAAAEGPERQGHKAWQQAGAGPTMPLCPACLPRPQWIRGKRSGSFLFWEEAFLRKVG